MSEGSDDGLGRLLSARRVGVVLSGGSSRCAFQVGVIEELLGLGVRPGLAVGVSAGAWNGAALAVGNAHRLRYYWRCFVRMPSVDLSNMLRERSPFRYAEMHRRSFARYVGAGALASPDALPLWVAVTRLRDRAPVLLSAREVERPVDLLLASNYLPPFYTLPPAIGGERYADGALSDNLPYEKAFDEGCDAVVIVATKGESVGGLGRRLGEPEHAIPERLAGRVVVIRPRHPLPVAFAARSWSEVERVMDLGRLRAREVLLGERWPETDARRVVRPARQLLWKAVHRVAALRAA